MLWSCPVSLSVTFPQPWLPDSKGKAESCVLPGVHKQMKHCCLVIKFTFDLF